MPVTCNYGNSGDGGNDSGECCCSSTVTTAVVMTESRYKVSGNTRIGAAKSPAGDRGSTW